MGKISSTKKREITSHSLRVVMICFILLMGSFQVFAQSIDDKISVECNNESLPSALKKIEKASKFKVLFTYNEIQSYRVSFSAVNETVSEVMNKALRKTPFKYVIKGKFITVSKNVVLTKKKLRGKVVDSKTGEPLIGATIYDTEDKMGVTTDSNGAFELTVPSNCYSINVSYVGYNAKRVSVSESKQMYIPMSESVQALKDVVVTGYQTLSKERSAGSFSLVKGDEIKDKANIKGSVLESLEGLSTGFNVNYSADADKYLIRGITSINSTRTPLFVVDGVPLSSDAIEEMVNNNDIESVTFLKDATAASIWGAQAANGVVVISTKRGANDRKLKISYDGSITYKGKPDYDYQDLMSSDMFIKNVKEVFDPDTYSWTNVTTTVDGLNGYYNPVVFPHEKPFYDYLNGTITESERDNELSQLASQDYRSQYEKYFMSNSFFTNHAISFSGGGNHYTYYGSLSYKGNKGIYKDMTNKYALNIRQIFDMTKWLTLDLTFNASIDKSHAHVLPTMTNLPYLQYKDADGNLLSQTDTQLYSDYADNVLSVSGINLNFYPTQDFNNSFYRTNGMNLRANGGVTIKIIDGLKYEGRFQYYRSSSKSEKYLPNDNFSVLWERAAATTSAGVQNLPKTGGWLTKGDAHNSDWTVRNQLSFDRSWNESMHQITALAGFEVRENRTHSYSNFVRGYDYQTMTYTLYDMNSLSSTGVATPLILNSTNSTNTFRSPYFNENDVRYRFVSYYGNFAYTYAKKYVLNGSIRVDQSNLFGTSARNQFKPIWSLGAAWHASEESFMADLKDINRLTLRLSYGLNGNSPDPGLGGPYDILNAYSSSLYPGQGFKIITPGNDKITWERTRVWNFGVDFAAFDNRLSGSFDVYSKHTTNLLGEVPLNSVTGWFSALGNLGNMNNHGFELTLNSRNIQTSDFEWNTEFTLTHNTNKITMLKVENAYNASNMPEANYIEGHAANTLFAYQWAGLSSKGLPQAYSSDGTTVTQSSNIANINSLKDCGSTTPKWFGSLSNSFRYQDFELSFMFVYNLGYKMRNDVNRFHYGRITENLHKDFDKRWRQAGDEKTTDVPAYSSAYDSSCDYYLYRYADINVLNASFVKLRDLSLIYSLPRMLCDKLCCDNIRVRLSAGNLFMIRANKEGIDPEAFSLKSGLRSDRYKPSFSAGVTINFK
jgi:TonB-linked SusC/RagA family outer membrane protein